MRRARLVLAGVVAMVASACATAPIEVVDRFEAADRSSVDVRAFVQPEHRREGPRYARAAVASLATLTQWLGAYPHKTLTLVDPPWRGSVAAVRGAIVVDRSPWWTSPVSMSPELATARAISRRLWSDSIDTTALPAWFTAALAEYSARRIVAPMFQDENLPPGFAMLELRYFGAFVPRFVRIRLRPESDGEPLTSYRADSRGDASSLEAKCVLTLNTLARWVGEPPFDAALAEFVRASRGTRPTIADFSRVASAATGQDLTWLLAPAFDGSAVFDYAVTDLRTESSGAGAFDTTLVVERRGGALFTGASAPRVGPFDSGRGVTVAVAFDDGARVVEAWDGRDARKTFRYRSAARARSAETDPDRVMLLDVRRTNNSITLSPRSGVAATRWSMRWLLWLEQLMLTWGTLA